MTPLSDLPAVQALGWALLHSLWQGAALALVYAAVRRALGDRGAGLRHVCGCLCLLLLLVLPTLTAARVVHDAGAPGPVASAGPAAASAVGIRLPADWRPGDRLATALPWLVAVWSLGVAGFAVRQAGGWALAGRLTRRWVLPAPPHLERTAARLARRLQVGRPVRVLRSLRLGTPAVVGWLRPAILVPAGALTGMHPSELETILAHELAHVRRHDYLVNLFQATVETLFFFHPAVWWISARVRDDRELCCDDLAAAACGDRLTCARALMRLEELRASPTPMALAAGSGRLFPRIRRLLAATPGSVEPGTRRRGAGAALAVGALLAAGLTLAAGAALAVPAGAPVVLGGLDPVQLTAGREVAGSPTLTVLHGGYRYRFADRDGRDAFRREPERFAVRNRSVCPISGRRVRGDVFRVVDGRIYLFCCPDVPDGLTAERLESGTA